nr:putative abc transporter atp-binding protein/permease [Quercus suber]
MEVSAHRVAHFTEPHSARPTVIHVHGLTVNVQRRDSVWHRLEHALRRAKHSEVREPRALLGGINTTVPAGTLTAILGTSGSGKSTFLNALAGRLSAKLRITGTISYHGRRDSRSLNFAYVAQHDCHAPSLTVRETLDYAAQLRLQLRGRDKSARRKAAVVQVIRQLGLELCADTKVGHGDGTGCSGGERRRLSLAVQLLSDPSVLYLDEVTTGLDAAAAYQLVRLLAQLTRSGKTIILTIHQPRSEMWKFFDRVMLLCEGGVVVDGSTHFCLQHLASLGHPMPPFVNPAEHLVDIAAIDCRSAKLESLSRSRVARLISAWSGRLLDDPQPARQDGQCLADKAFWRQRVAVQTFRRFKISCREPNIFAGSIIECIGMGILTGWIFYGLDGTQAGIRSREGALYIAVVLQSYLVLLYETYRLTLDWRLFRQEKEDGVVDIWSFLLSRRLANLLLIDIPVPLIFSIIVYFMVGFRAYASQFFVFFGIILLTHLISVTLAAFAVVLSNEFAGASLFVNLNLNLQALCCGFLIQTNQIPVYVQWLKWLAYAWYATGAAVTNEFLGTSASATGYLYDCPFPGGSTDPRCLVWTGRYVVSELGIPEQNWVWRPAIVLLGYIALLWSGTGVMFSCLTGAASGVRSVAVSDSSPYVESLPCSDQQHVFGLSIVMENLTIDVSKRILPSLRFDKTPILGPMSATFFPGMLNVIMGVSGAGKSTLLNIAAARYTNTFWTRYDCSGSIAHYSHADSLDTARPAAYVNQTDETLQATMTVRETICFAARLRLPATMLTPVKLARAEEVIQQLGLRSCANTLIGDDLVKGISGGERRRVSIAIKILTRPKVLFLDEPTSGLDAFTASTILQVLRNLAAHGCTVVLTIHQPRSDHFQHFDNILLLASKGRLIYAGPGQDMLTYFSSHNQHCPRDMNPADFVIDLVSTTASMPCHTQLRCMQGIEWLEGKTVGSINLFGSMAKKTTLLEQRSTTLSTTAVLLQRSSLAFCRSRPMILARTTQVLGFAILLTLFFAPLKADYQSVQSHVGLLQEILAVYFIGMLQNVAIYPQEQASFLNEFNDRIYGIEPFFISYTLLAIPFDILNGVLVALLAAFAIGLNRSGSTFGVIAYVCFALISCGESVGMLFNTLFESTGFAVSIISVILSLGIMMSGVLSLNLPTFLDAINHINPVKWSTIAMATYSLKGKTFSCTAAQEVDGKCPLASGDDVLALYNLADSDGLSLLWLTLLVLGYRLLAYVVLRIRLRGWKPGCLNPRSHMDVD